MQVELNTLISVGTSIVAVTSYVVTSKLMSSNLKDSLEEFKQWTKEHIKTEKTHALQLANLRIGNIECDIDEVFPRLRCAEEKIQKVDSDTQKNCACLTQLKKDCRARHKEVTG